MSRMPRMPRVPQLPSINLRAYHRIRMGNPLPQRECEKLMHITNYKLQIVRQFRKFPSDNCRWTKNNGINHFTNGFSKYKPLKIIDHYKWKNKHDISSSLSDSRVVSFHFFPFRSVAFLSLSSVRWFGRTSYYFLFLSLRSFLCHSLFTDCRVSLASSSSSTSSLCRVPGDGGGWSLSRFVSF